MAREFFETERQLNTADIQEIEAYMGFELPNQYKQHLLKYNGGRCSPSEFYFDEDGETASSFIDWFLAIYDGEYDNLKKYIQDYKIDEKRMPSKVFPVAHDPGGNLVCMDSEDGKIYFWDHENEVDYSVNDDSERSNLYLIANSFNEFLNGLREVS